MVWTKTTVMSLWQYDQFWTQNIEMEDSHVAGWSSPFSFTCCWTWTFAVILVIFTCRALRLRLPAGGLYFLSSPSTTPRSNSLPSSRIAPQVISDSDLKDLINCLDGGCPNDSVWENAIDKRNNSVSYSAKCFKPKDGPMKYLTVTTFEGCPAEFLLKFFMDNHYRMEWDKSVVSHQQLQRDIQSGIEIGCTIKKFPFLSPREYVLAWKLWQGRDGSFYCVSKECEHPLAPKGSKHVRVSLFRSGWRIKKVVGRNASEIRMVHQEDAGLNAEMAKLAFSKGIWSFVCKMDDALRKYSARQQHQLSSSIADFKSIQKVPLEFEVTDNESSNDHPDKSIKSSSGTAAGSRKLNTRRLHRRPSSKLITNGLLLLGGAICLSRGHSSFGAKVAMAYMLSKLTKRKIASPTTVQPTSLNTR
ncbi:uncharacterized protein LOC127254743 isoform X2 [Andrographis paniculata]|uniref:uncharacterized protein LOC127254743 isoform X2 n=1 Tax=Andrographis paniculata TaxID=175694 RepID=UPI0021E99209|nr:uncharacterized protein LOC127254743 isoform X2 [Andrographis paniculata]